MEGIETRVEALEGAVRQMGQRAACAERRARRWRLVAGGLLTLCLTALSLIPGNSQVNRGVPDRLAAVEAAVANLQQSVAALQAWTNTAADRFSAVEDKLTFVSRDGTDVYLTGANLHIVNGTNDTTLANGLGNLIVGYNEGRQDGADDRSGSHCIVAGQGNNYSSYGGIVVGNRNTISAPFASVSGGTEATASGFASSVSGGAGNQATSDFASVSGGWGNQATSDFASVSGGVFSTAEGWGSSVSAGQANRASGPVSSVSAGYGGLAEGWGSSVSGGQANTASWAATSVSGGYQRQATAWGSWRAGSYASGP